MKKDIFLPMAHKKQGTSAYYEFSYCKKDLPLADLTDKGYKIWQEDALLVYIDDDAELFRHYLCYLSPAHAPNGTDEFSPYGVNYYTKAEAAAILQRLKAENPPYSAPLIAWLENGEEYNGFFFLGI